MAMRRALLAFAAVVLALAAGPARAQTYPTSPIRLVVPFAPGGGADLMARILADPLAKRLGQPIVIENKPGGGATLGADLVAKAAPDGYTLLWTTPGPQITNPYLMQKLPYDPNKDFTPVATVVTAVNVLVVTPSLPVKSVAELIAYAKSNPGKLNYSSAGVGASSHLSGALLGQMAGIDIVHVPYRGSGPALQDLPAGNVQMAIDTVAVLLPHIHSGGVRALGVATVARNPTLPDMPPIADTLPGFEGSSINYINGPAGLPQTIAERLNREINAVLGDAEVQKRMQIAGFTPIIESQPALVKRIVSEQEKWKKVIALIK
jgi:tripartite-type tricarboxylate transporter receptor subunit TctC